MVIWRSGEVAHLHVHPDMIRKATNEELGPLTRGDVPGGTCHRLEAIRELLHSGNKRQPAQLSQPTPADRRAKAQTTQLLEALPRWHALVLLEGVVPSLGRPPEMIGGEPGTVGGERALTPKELFTLVEPIQGIDGAVVCGELQLVKLGWRWVLCGG